MQLFQNNEITQSLAGKIGEPVKGDRYIHVRVADDAGADRIITKRFGKGIIARIGWKGDRSYVISVLFDKTRWDGDKARAWYKSHRESLASTAEDALAALEWTSFGSIYVEPELIAPDDDLGFDIPEPTPTKAYTIFRLLSFFPTVNQRHDSFHAEDVSDAAIESLLGSQIFGNDGLTDHYNRSGERGPQVGTVLDARRDDKAIYALAAIYKDVLYEHYGLDANDLPKGYSVSMEVRFDPDEARYLLGDQVFTRSEAISRGLAAVQPEKDDPRKYDARFLTPIEYHAVALLRRGHNADPTADVLLAAASVDKEDTMQIEWHEGDFEAHVSILTAYGAEISSKQRENLDRSDFAYVDEDDKGHLPIHDAAHVRNALARLNQTNIPTDAKRKAFRKILAAARKFGIDVEKDSAIFKTYGAMHSSEERCSMFKEMMKNGKSKSKKRAMASEDADVNILSDLDQIVLLSEEGTLYSAALRFDDEANLVIDEITELAQSQTVKEATMDENQVQEALRAAREEAAQAKEAEMKAAFTSREAEIAKAAVEQFRASDEMKTLLEEAKANAIQEYEKMRETVAARLQEVEKIHPFKDATERQAIEARIVESISNDAEWYKVKVERLELAVANASKRSPAIKKEVPTLVAKGSANRNIFDFTQEA